MPLIAEPAGGGGRDRAAGATFSIAAMTEDQRPSDSSAEPRPSTAGATTTPPDGGADPRQDESSGGILRMAALLAVVVILVAVIVVKRSGGQDQTPQSSVPVTPLPKNLAKAGYTEEDDGRFDPPGFGMTFDYPAKYFELLSPAGESSRDDETLGIAERRRHFIFRDSSKTATKATEAQPTFRVIRIKYQEPLTSTGLSDFRTKLLSQPGDEPSEIETIGGVPAFTRTYSGPGGGGSTTYFASGGMLYQLVSFADTGDKRAVERDLNQILNSVAFGS